MVDDAQPVYSRLYRSCDRPRTASVSVTLARIRWVCGKLVIDRHRLNLKCDADGFIRHASLDADRPPAD